LDEHLLLAGGLSDLEREYLVDAALAGVGVYGGPEHLAGVGVFGEAVPVRPYALAAVVTEAVEDDLVFAGAAMPDSNSAVVVVPYEGLVKGPLIAADPELMPHFS
jgi:hypothetical protein